MAFLSENAIFRSEIALEAIARQSVEASREVSCAFFGNIGRNSEYFLLPIFLAVHPSVHAVSATPDSSSDILYLRPPPPEDPIPNYDGLPGTRRFLF